MNTLDWVIAGCTICGVLMVAGGILLLYKGIIRLNDVSAEEAVAVEFQKMLKIQTRYPALGLFVIGLVFVCVAIIYANSEEIKPIKLKGTIDITGADLSGVTLRVKSADWKTFRPDSTGRINEIIHPDLQRIVIEVQAAGCEPEAPSFNLGSEDINRGVLSLPKMVFKKVSKKPGQGEVVPGPPDKKLEPLEAKPAF
jgi:hypothetical protein